MNFKRYFRYKEGLVPIVLSCVHGGYKRPRYLPDRQRGVVIPDYNTYFISKRIIQLLKQNNIKIYYILNKIHRSKVDLNRPARSSVAFEEESKIAREIHKIYHDKIKEVVDECVLKYGKCLFIDFHGFTQPKKNYPDIIIGNVFGKSLNYQRDNNYWGFQELVDELSQEFSLDDGLSMNDFNLAYSGGYITYQFCDKNGVNALQIELAKYIRFKNELINNFTDHLVKAIKKIDL